LPLTPDIAGFVAASQQLRELFGVDCVFHVPQDPVWPAGTRINADTGEPYSAMVKRTNAEFTDVTKTVLLILKQGSPLRPQADTHFSEAGLLSGMDLILDVDAADYPDIVGATELTTQGLDYKIEERKPFSLANNEYRWLIYAMEK
jgi:hypothetical protein